MERREHVRFTLRAPVEFLWKDTNGVEHKGGGFARNISSQGVYVDAALQPPTGSEIHIDIFFSPVLGRESNVQMSGEAKVIRVDPTLIDERSGGFVAVSSSFRLLDGKVDLEK